MFGRHYPVASPRIGYARLVEEMRRMPAGLGHDERDAVLRRNVLDFYRIAPTART